jgi:Flp pilus assembly pilin Flp
MNRTSPKRPDRSGQGLSEYIILVMLIAVCSIAASRMVGSTIKSKLDTINQKLQEIHIP